MKKLRIIALTLLLAAILSPAAALAAEPDEISAAQPAEIYIPGGDGDNQALLDAFAWQKLNAGTAPRLRAIRDPGASLSGVNRTVYEKLKAQITLVANGKRSSTRFEIPVSELGLEKTSWTAAELGLDTILTAEGNAISNEAMAAVNREVGITLRSIVSCLQSACPFELYWYDKTVGTTMQYYSYRGTRDGTTIRIFGSTTFTFAVTKDYSDGSAVTVDGTSYLCGVNGIYADRINAAVSRAAAIVSQYAGQSDPEKLKAYRDVICDSVSYDNDALIDSTAYGDPWQLISVFDGDPDTNVVCEGYAKAFQYLCDRTDFHHEIVSCCVNGYMSGGTGAGSHMWNLVRMDDGKVYLVDVTNCDYGTVGYPDGLFLKNCKRGSAADGYVFASNSSEIRYYYDNNIREVFSEEELTVSGTAYEEPPAYNLCFDANGGSGAPDALRSDSLNVPQTVPVRSGWYFLGWAESEDAVEASRQPGERLTLTDDMTLYAVWVQPDLVLPASLREIEPEAFADCPQLHCVLIPAETEIIAVDAFGDAQGLTILGVPGSAAESFAARMHFGFVPITQ